MSIRVTLNCHLKTQKTDALLLFIRENLANVRAFDGCLSVDILLAENNREMLIEEQWLSIEHHQQYMAFINDNGILKQLLVFLKKQPDIKYFTKIDI